MYKLAVAAVAMVLTACAPSQSQVGMANPASAYCVEIGGTVSIQDQPSGQIGICTLPDGSTVEEWQLFRQDNP